MAARSPAAARYARAVFRLAEESNLLPAVESDLRALVELAEKSPEFAGFLANPVLPPERRQAAIKALFEGRAHPLTLRVLLLLAERRRLAELSAIAEAFLGLLRERNKQARVRVVSAAPLGEDQLRRLVSALSARTGLAITADTEIDPSLIGGFRVHHGDQVLDASVAARLSQYQRQVLAAF
jgi:ATP synthase F1 delta subunit